MTNNNPITISGSPPFVSLHQMGLISWIQRFCILRKFYVTVSLSIVSSRYDTLFTVDASISWWTPPNGGSGASSLHWETSTPLFLVSPRSMYAYPVSLNWAKAFILCACMHICVYVRGNSGEQKHAWLWVCLHTHMCISIQLLTQNV